MPRTPLIRTLAAATLAAAALAASAVAVLDPARGTGATYALAPAVLAVLVVPSGRSRRATCFAAALAALWSLVARVGPEFRGDAGSYFVYLRSATFDGDLDFRNDWEGLERPLPALMPDGRPLNTQSVGPALAWSPFFAAAHAYVLWERAHGRSRYAADGFAPPYRRAAALGTPVFVLASLVLLGGTLARRFGSRIGWMTLGAAVLATPVVYYTVVVPSMAHGLTFAACAALLWACVRAENAPGARRWLAVGALMGVAALVRWQSAVWALFAGVLAIREVRRGRGRAGWLAGAAALAFVVLLPQFLAWRALYGRFLTVPQGAGYMDLSAPHLVDVLFSADHGLFAWSPVAWLGLAGLVVGWRRDAWLHTGALVTFAATAWVNGSVTDWDWAAGDAFGARRFDVVVPLLAWGLAALVRAARPALARAPLVAPATLLTGLVAWNVGLVALFREGRYPGAAPFDRVAADQARLGRELALAAAGRLAGESGHALAYKHLSGEYLYDLHPDGVIELPAEERLLLRGWSARANRTDTPHFRWALGPEACLLVPLADAHPVTFTVDARAPRRALPQTMTAAWNGHVLGDAPLTPEWSAASWTAPRDTTHAGENTLCLRFSGAAPGEDGERVAAAVARVSVRTD